MRGLLARYLHLLAAPLRVLAVLIRTHAGNRARLSRFTARARVAQLLRALSVLTVGVWVAIWLLASDAQRERLTDAVKSYLSGSAPARR